LTGFLNENFFLEEILLSIMNQITSFYEKPNGTKIKLTWIKDKEIEKYKPCYQVYGICFNEKGEVLIRKDGEKYSLSGGTPEKGEAPLQTLERELIEESDITIKKAIPLGVQKVEYLSKNEQEVEDDIFYQYRYICLIDKLLDQTPDPDNGKTYGRFFVPQNKVFEYIDWRNVGNAMFSDAFKEFQNLLK
jgi:8-oxo-dGTP pyrophosphatase MutT (NUDIX family)